MEGTNEEILNDSELVGDEYLEQQEDAEFGQEGGDFGMNDDAYFDEDFDATASEGKPLGGIYALFNNIINKKDSTKVSNLNKVELGELGISVRESMRIALLADTFHHKIFARFFRQQSGIISDSAMSKDGWLTELTVTSKRYASRESSSNVDSVPKFNKGKWTMFSGKNKQRQNG